MNKGGLMWTIFVALLIIVPIGILSIRQYGIKKIKPTREQIKTADKNFISLCLFYWICDFFYLTFILDNLIWRFILGGLILVKIFYNLSLVFINGNSPFKFGLVQDFLIGIGLTVYLIYIVPNEDLKQIIIPVVSAVYGGLLTLIGVAWNIKKSDRDRKEEDIKKAKPIVFICSPETSSVDYKSVIKKLLISKQKLGTLKHASVKGKYYILPHVLINNSDYSYATMKGFVINNDFHLYDFGQVLPKNSIVHLMNDFTFKYNKKIKYVAILIQDMLDNLYELELNFKIKNYENRNEITVNSGIELRPTKLSINTKEI